MYRTSDKISATIQKCTTNNIVPRLNELYNLTSYGSSSYFWGSIEVTTTHGGQTTRNVFQLCQN